MRLLLDSHVASALAERLRSHGVDAVALPEWQGGNYRSADDRSLLRAAHADGCVLLTFDCQTIPTLLKELAETGAHHGGVILVSSRTFRANDISGLLGALLALFESRRDEPWEDIAVFLRR